MLCPGALTASITALALALAEGRSSDELAMLGAVLTQLGDTLATISLQKSLLPNRCEDNADRQQPKDA